MKLAVVLGLAVFLSACSTSPTPDMSGGTPSPMPGQWAGNGASPANVFMGNETTLDQALSVVDFEQFKGGMSLPIIHVFRERPAEQSNTPISTLEYSAAKADGRGLIVKLLYDGTPASVQLGAAGGGVSIWEPASKGGQWQSVRGTVAIRGGSNENRVKIELSDVELEVPGVGTRRTAISGYVEGQLMRQCYKLQTSTQPISTQNGPVTVTEHVADQDWSSPFCASVKPF